MEHVLVKSVSLLEPLSTLVADYSSYSAAIIKRDLVKISRNIYLNIDKQLNN